MMQDLWMDRRPTVLGVPYDLQKVAYTGGPDYVPSASYIPTPGRTLPSAEAVAKQFVEVRLRNWRPAAGKPRDCLLVGIPSDDVVAGAREARGGYRAEMPETQDGNVHARLSRRS